MSTELSYHDLYITTESIPRMRISALPFDVMVTCTRTAGWEVWRRPDPHGPQVMVAGEYGGEGLILDVAGHNIVDSLARGARGEESDVTTARALAQHLFAHKRDRAGEPYINHVARVAEACTTDEQRTVAWLHDVVEDCDMELDTLRETFSSAVCDAVDALSRRENENYLHEYIPRLMRNELACEVKQHDLRDNMDLKRLPVVERKDVDRWMKYDEAYIAVRTALHKFDRARRENPNG